MTRCIVKKIGVFRLSLHHGVVVCGGLHYMNMLFWEA